MNMMKKLLALVLSVCLVFGLVGGVSAAADHTGEMNELLATLQEMATKYGPEIPEEVKNGTDKGTTIGYNPTKDSYYVAIGDGSVKETATYATYVSALAQELKLGDKYKNLGVKDLLIENVIVEVIEPNKDVIAKADLVTIGFSAVGFANMALEEVLRDEGEASSIRWEKYLDETGVAEIKAILADLEQYLKDVGVRGAYNVAGMKLDVVKSLVIAAESMAYGALAFSNELPAIIEKIHEYSPNAKVVIVGMDNPMAGAVVNLSGGEAMELGKYLDSVIEMTCQIAQTVAIENPKTAFVAAPAAANTNDGAEMSENDLIIAYLPQNVSKNLPNAEGQAYIKTQIKNALYLMGDVNDDGKVDYKDAMLVLRASVKLETLNDKLAVRADVTGEGKMDYKDAMKILRASVGLDTLG